MFPQVKGGRGTATVVALNDHRYESCPDKDCPVPYCRIWREAWKEGFDEGYGSGSSAGFENGFAAGQAAGCSH